MEYAEALPIVPAEDAPKSPLSPVLPTEITNVDLNTTDHERKTKEKIDTEKKPLDKENAYHHHHIPSTGEAETAKDQHQLVKQEEDIRNALPSPPSSLGPHSPNSPTFKPVNCKRKSDEASIQGGEEKQTKTVRLDDSGRRPDPSPADDLALEQHSSIKDDSTASSEPPIWCRRCGVTESVRWRYGPVGKSTLCNACHLRWKSVGKPDEGYNHTTYPPEGAASIQALRKPKSKSSGTRPRSRASTQTTVTVKQSKKTIEHEEPLIEKPDRRRKKTSVPEVSKATTPSKSETAPSSVQNPFSHIPTDGSVVPNDCCSLCKATTTSLWRRGPAGPRTLCNACGLRWAKYQLDSGAASRPQPSPVATPVAKSKEIVAADQGQQLLRDRKIYLKAGMYASLHKSSIIPSKPRRAAAMKGPPKMHWKGNGSQPGGESKFTIPEPIHQGTFIMTTLADFCLPPDIVQEYELGLIGKFGSRPTLIKKPAFMRIRSNIFVERKANKTDHQVACQCIPPSNGEQGCGDDCLNRMLFYECEPKSCPCGDKCSNQRFQRREGRKELDIFLTRERGWGLRTLVDIKRGELIIEYRGEIISHKTCEERMNTMYKNQKNFYFLDYRNGEVIDACTKGTEARFINHSCAPNCHIEKWALKGELHVGVFASKDIPASSELFYDYNFSVFGNTESQQRCYCGSNNCRGTIGKKLSRRDTRLLGEDPRDSH